MKDKLSRRGVRTRSLRIAVASSGLGHVTRGIESWAEDTARELRNAGANVTLFQAAPTVDEPWRRVVRCTRRGAPITQQVSAILERFGGWRYGCGSTYELEQTSFSLGLWQRVCATYDVVHVQDPHIALVMDSLNRAGLSRPRVILAHGTEEHPDRLSKYTALQHLAPCYARSWLDRRPDRQLVFAIPNFVNVEEFSPGNRDEARVALGLPRDCYTVLCVAAIKSHHKRVDALIDEFARFRAEYRRPCRLLVAGSRCADTNRIISLASNLGTDVAFMTDVERSRMSQLYRAADVFALASQHEMMPIAMLEAMASGLPIACNDTPVMRWMVGRAGEPSDINRPGALAQQLMAAAVPEVRSRRGKYARWRAEAMFSAASVVPQITDMYRQVCATL